MSETQRVATPSWMTLDRDERVLLTTRPSSNLIMAGAVVGFFVITLVSIPFILAGAVDAGRNTTFGLAGLVMLAVIGIYVVIHRNEYAVTTKRVAVATGLRDETVDSIPVESVDDVVLEQARWQRLLGVGTLRFVTDGGTDVTFDLVGSPHYVYERALDFTQGSATVTGNPTGRGSPT